MPPKLEALHTSITSGWTLQVDALAARAIAAGDWYWESTADGGSGSLRAAIQTALAADVASTTVVINDATGVMTITWGSGTHTLTWGGSAATSFRNRCGFAANLTPAAALFASPKQVKGLLLPNTAASDQEASVGTQGRRTSDRVITRSRSGAIVKTSKNRTYKQLFRFVNPKAKVWIANESLGNESGEQFWADCLDCDTPGPFRYYPDRTVDATYFTYHDMLEDGYRPTKRVRRNDVAWEWELPCVGYVHALTGGGF